MKTLILTAAGKGTRANVGINKVLYKVKDKTILEYTLKKFIDLDFFNQIIIVVLKQDYQMVKKELKDYDVKIVIGSDQRYKSVKRGVDNSINEIIYIHDSARPYIKKEDILNIENEIKKNRSIKCFSLAKSLKDTICEVKGNKVANNLNRNKLMALLTPQVIYKKEYLKIYDENILTTDETSLFKRNNYDVFLIKTNNENDKITTKEDIKRFEEYNG